MTGIDWNSTEWDPVPEGTLRLRSLRTDRGTPFDVQLRWLGGGWAQVVGLRLGTFRHPVVPQDGRGDWDLDPREGVIESLVAPLDMREAASAARRAEHFLEDYAATQRLAMVWRDIEAGVLTVGRAPAALGGQPFKLLRSSPNGAHDEVAIAASLYRLFAEVGSHKPTEDVAAATQVSRATAARRIREARAAGLLGEARRGTAGEAAR